MPLQLPGTNEYGLVTNPPFLTDNTGTVIFWVNIAVLEFAFLAGILTEGATDDEVIVFVNSVNGDLVLGYNDGGVAQFQATMPNGTVSANTWHLIAWTSDGSTMKFFVDGVEIVLTPTIGANTGQWFQDAANADVFALGVLKRAAPSFYLDGTFNAVGIYNIALSQPEITAVFNEKMRNSLDKTQTGNQRSHYPLDDGEGGANASGDTFRDVWGTVDGTISGTAPLWENDTVLSYPGDPSLILPVAVSSPSVSPSVSPSESPSTSPSLSPSVSPSASPSVSPSGSPSVSPSLSPSLSPSGSPSFSVSPSASPSVSPSASPSVSPSPSGSPSTSPSASPSISPSASPSPSTSPSASPSIPPAFIENLFRDHVQNITDYAMVKNITDYAMIENVTDYAQIKGIG